MEIYDTISTILEDPEFKMKVELFEGMLLGVRTDNYVVYFETI